MRLNGQRNYPDWCVIMDFKDFSLKVSNNVPRRQAKPRVLPLTDHGVRESGS